jgi:ABC-type glycerol-3-phosphate transport system substrate-binding protein
MAFLLAYEQQAQLALEGVQPPALRSIYEDGDLLATEPTLQALYAALSVTRPRPQSAHYAELSEIIYSEVNAMLRGEQDAATTAAQVQRRLERLLAP